MKRRHTIVHGFGRHNIVCRFSRFWRNSKNYENHEKQQFNSWFWKTYYRETMVDHSERDSSQC